MLAVGDMVKVKYPDSDPQSRFQGQMAMVVRHKGGEVYGLLLSEAMRIMGDDGMEHTYLYEEGRYLERQRDSN